MNLNIFFLDNCIFNAEIFFFYLIILTILATIDKKKMIDEFFNIIFT